MSMTTIANQVRGRLRLLAAVIMVCATGPQAFAGPALPTPRRPVWTIPQVQDILRTTCTIESLGYSALEHVITCATFKLRIYTEGSPAETRSRLEAFRTSDAAPPTSDPRQEARVRTQELLLGGKPFAALRGRSK